MIIEGETGVGKTALVEMLSKLWNQSLLNQWRRKKEQIMEFMRRKLGDLNNSDNMDEYMVGHKVYKATFLVHDNYWHHVRFLHTVG